MATNFNNLAEPFKLKPEYSGRLSISSKFLLDSEKNKANISESKQTTETPETNDDERAKKLEKLRQEVEATKKRLDSLGVVYKSRDTSKQEKQDADNEIKQPKPIVTESIDVEMSTTTLGDVLRVDVPQKPPPVPPNTDSSVVGELRLLRLKMKEEEEQAKKLKEEEEKAKQNAENRKLSKKEIDERLDAWKERWKIPESKKVEEQITQPKVEEEKEEPSKVEEKQEVKRDEVEKQEVVHPKTDLAQQTSEPNLEDVTSKLDAKEKPEENDQPTVENKDLQKPIEPKEPDTSAAIAPNNEKSKILTPEDNDSVVIKSTEMQSSIVSTPLKIETPRVDLKSTVKTTQSIKLSKSIAEYKSAVNHLADVFKSTMSLFDEIQTDLDKSRDLSPQQEFDNQKEVNELIHNFNNLFKTMSMNLSKRILKTNQSSQTVTVLQKTQYASTDNPLQQSTNLDIALEKYSDLLVNLVKKKLEL